MLTFVKTWTSRRKAEALTDKAVEDAKITRDDMRDSFADVLTQKTAARR